MKCSAERLVDALIGVELAKERRAAEERKVTARKASYVVTVSRGYGSLGKQVAQALADRLKVRCCDRDILETGGIGLGLREPGGRKEGSFRHRGGIQHDVTLNVGDKGLFAPYQLPMDLGGNGVYPSSYRRPHVNLNRHCIDHRAGFDRGLTSSYSRAG